MVLHLADVPVLLGLVFVLFQLVALASIVSFGLTFKLKTPSVVHRILFLMTWLYTQLLALIHLVRCIEPLYVPVGPNPLLTLMSPEYIKMETLYGDAGIIGFAVMNATDVFIAFMWIELYYLVRDTSSLTSNDNKKQRRLAWLRNGCTVLAFASTIISQEGITAIAYKYLGLQKGGTIGTIAMALTFVVPIIVSGFAIARWRKIHLLMKECIKANTRSGKRFIALSKITLIAFYNLFNVILYMAVLNKQLFDPSIPVIIIISDVPNLMLAIGVCWYFSPLRKLYEEGTIGSSTVEIFTVSADRTKTVDSGSTDSKTDSKVVEVA